MVTVFTNGCFDILHPGHMKLFEYAKSLGDSLIVGIDSDCRISTTKEGRPIFGSRYRKEMLKAIRYIDKVHVFDSDKELSNLVLANKVDIMVVGSDWRSKRIIGSEYAKEVKYFERDARYSTTKTIERIGSGGVMHRRIHRR